MFPRNGFLLLLLGMTWIACRSQYTKPNRSPSAPSKGLDELENGEVIDADKAKPDAPPPSAKGTKRVASDGIGEAGRLRIMYRPQCSPKGVSISGRRAYTLSFERDDLGKGLMRQTSGEGFACKLDPDTDADKVHPLCTQVCPQYAGSIEDGWGWCRNVKSFPCAIDADLDEVESPKRGE